VDRHVQSGELQASSREWSEGYLDNHIAPLIGAKRLNELTVPAVPVALAHSGRVAGRGVCRYIAQIAKDDPHRTSLASQGTNR
jgi:hypothetical protein